MNTIEIKLNEPLTLAFTGPKGNVFKMTIECDGTVVTNPKPTDVVFPDSEIASAKKALASVQPVIDGMVKNKDFVNLRKIGTAYYTLILSNQYSIEQQTTALESNVGYLPSSFLIAFKDTPEVERSNASSAFVKEIQRQLLAASLPGVY